MGDIFWWNPPENADHCECVRDEIYVVHEKERYSRSLQNDYIFPEFWEC